MVLQDADIVAVENGEIGMHVVTERCAAGQPAAVSLFSETATPAHRLHVEVWQHGMHIGDAERVPGGPDDDAASTSQQARRQQQGGRSSCTVTSCWPLLTEGAQVQDFGQGVKMRVPMDTTAAHELQEKCYAWVQRL